MCYLKTITLLFCVTSIVLGQASSGLDKHLKELEERGFTVVEGIFSSDEIDQLSKQLSVEKQRAFDLIERSPLLERVFTENNREHRALYWKKGEQTILQAGKGRYDLYQGFQGGIFGTDAILRHPVLESLMKETLVNEYTNYSGVIYSQVGSEDQYWHRDTHTLSSHRSDGKQLVQLDDFYFTVLIPLTVSFTEENGATEFFVGSHRLSCDEFDQCSRCQVEVPLGSALVFNGKVNHRGRANCSQEDRPALYVVYHKKWYNDQYRKGVD